MTHSTIDVKYIIKRSFSAVSVIMPGPICHLIEDVEHKVDGERLGVRAVVFDARVSQVRVTQNLTGHVQSL